MKAPNTASDWAVVGRNVTRPRVALAVLAVLLALYAVAIHPWFINWGATERERQMALPGDELNADPRWQTTRAVTINASTGEVWAWLIQHGQDRAGFYSYTWLENLTGADIHNTDQIRPEWQGRAVGDAIPMARPDLLGGRMGETSVVRVAAIEPGRALVVTGQGADTGAWILAPIDARTTRLIVRERNGEAGVGSVARVTGSVIRSQTWDPTHFVMQHGMLVGLKARAEGDPNPPTAVGLASRAGWLTAGVALLGLFLRRRRFGPWLVLPVVAATPAMLTTGDMDAALAGFLAAGITTLGAVAFGWRWWPPFALIAAAVLLVLLLSPDAYVAFGLLFDALLVGAAGWMATRTLRTSAARPLRTAL